MEKITKKKYKASVLSREPFKRRSEAEMLKIVAEITNGSIAKRTACRKYGLNRNTLALFIRKFSVRTLGNNLSTQLFATMTDAQKLILLEKKIKELTKTLEHAKLKSESLETMIKVAEEDLHIRIKKKRGSKQSKE
jgi:transposase-like protein